MNYCIKCGNKINKLDNFCTKCGFQINKNISLKEKDKKFNDYVILDLENPNFKANSICSIAIAIVKNNEIVDVKYSLINPEDKFDAKNSQITGIDNSMVIDKPIFSEYWQEISDILTNNIVIGHNIVYDFSVLSKTLNRYSLEIPIFEYICTLDLSKKYMNLESYSLIDISKNLNVDYISHNAKEDVIATFKLFEHIQDCYDLNTENTKKYEYREILKKNIDSRLSSNINDLYGIIKGINYDGIINDKEIELLNQWIKDNYVNVEYSLFKRIITKLNSILEDGKISEYERIELTTLVDSVNESKIYSKNTLSIQILQGIINGIRCDNKIVIEEVSKLKQWLDENNHLIGIYPYDKVCLIVNDVLKDEILLEDEKKKLMSVFNELLEPLKIDSNDSLDLENKTFCLTGDFINGTKAEITEKLESYGGISKSGVSGKLDYLFVGSLGSENWKYGNSGGKIAKAQELQEKGNMIKIISEKELFEKIN